MFFNKKIKKILCYLLNFLCKYKNVVLIQDKNNEYDMYAVKVLTSDGKFMPEHIPMTCSEEVFDLIER